MPPEVLPSERLHRPLPGTGRREPLARAPERISFGSIEVASSAGVTGLSSFSGRTSQALLDAVNSLLTSETLRRHREWWPTLLTVSSPVDGPVLERTLNELFEEPIQDGVTHSAERLVAQATRTSAGRRRLSALLADSGFAHRVGLLRCIGRIPVRDVAEWGVGRAAEALEDRSAEVRDAAIRALELLGHA